MRIFLRIFYGKYEEEKEFLDLYRSIVALKVKVPVEGETIIYGVFMGEKKTENGMCLSVSRGKGMNSEIKILMENISSFKILQPYEVAWLLNDCKFF